MEKLFTYYRPKVDKLLTYGFGKVNEAWQVDSLIMNGDFILQVFWIDKQLTYKVFDRDTGEEYRQVHQKQLVGQFVSQVREAILSELLSIRDSCFERVGSWSGQGERILTYVQENFGTQPDFLWEKSAHTAALRHAISKKWYAILMLLDWKLLDSNKNGLVQIMNVRSHQVAHLIKSFPIYPAYHMNKKYWVSLPLDESLSDEQIQDFLLLSFEQTKTSLDK